MQVPQAPSTDAASTDAIAGANAPAQRLNTDVLSSSQLAQTLRAAVETANSKHDAFLAMTAVAVNYSNATALVYFDRGHDGRLRPLDDQALEEIQIALGTSRNRWLACCEQTCREGQPQRFSVDETVPATLMVMPVPVIGADAEAVCAVFPQRHAPTRRVEILLQFVAVYMSLWRANHVANTMDGEAATLAAVLEVVTQVQLAPTLEHAAFTLTSQVTDFLGCQRTALGMRAGSGDNCHLVALSGSSKVDHHSSLARAIEAALDETLQRDKLNLWPPESQADRSAAVAHECLCDVAGCSLIVSTPMRSDTGEAVGVLLLISDNDVASRDKAVRFVRAAEVPVGTRLAQLARRRRNPLIKACQSVVRQVRSRWQR